MTAQKVDSPGLVKKIKEPAQRVTVTDLDISFSSMFNIMFKAFFAAILVAICLSMIGGLFTIVAMGLNGHKF